MGYFADILATQEAQNAGRESWDYYSRQMGLASGGSLEGGFNSGTTRRTVEDISRLSGFTGQALMPKSYTARVMEGDSGEVDRQYNGQAINPGLMKHLEGYRFAPGANGDEYTNDMFDPAGQKVGSFASGDRPTGFWKALPGITTAALVAMTGGAAAYGLGLVGAGAGAGGGVGAGLGAFEGIGGAMAAGGAPMTAAEFAAIGAGGGAGAAGAGAGAEAALGAFEGIGGNMAAGGAPMTGAEFAAAGAGGGGAQTSFEALRAAEHANMGQTAGNIPRTVNMGSLGGTTGTASGFQGAFDVGSQMLNDATAAGGVGGDWWDTAKGVGKAVQPYVGAASDIYSGIKGKRLADEMRKASDPFAQYRAGYGQQLAALEANPGSISMRPGFQAGLETIGRKSAASGYYGSGNMASALSRYSGDFYNQEASRLAGLAGAGATPGAGQQSAADLTGRSLGSIGYGLEEMLARFMKRGPK